MEKHIIRDKNKKSEWTWATYFNAKKQKLQQQFEENRDEAGPTECDEKSRILFKNVSIFVNGYTNPTAIELKALMIKHGGTYFEYQNDMVTHIIASNLASTKIPHVKNLLVVKPEWIVDSIKAGKLLDTATYRVIVDRGQAKMTKFLKAKSDLDEKAAETAKDSSDALSSQSQPIPKDICDSPPLIDLTQSPKVSPSHSIVYDDDHPDAIAADESMISIQSQGVSGPSYEHEFKCFSQKLEMVQLPNEISKDQSKLELKKEKIKFLLHDWILWTSSSSSRDRSSHVRLDRSLLTNNSFSQSATIDSDDLDIFKGYVLYYATKRRDFEMIFYIMKILKTLIKKLGSFEWVSAYREISSAVQAEFYEKYDAVLDLD